MSATAYDIKTPLRLSSKKAEHKASLVVIHGLGDSAQGWADPGRQLAAAFPGLHVILPTAPIASVTINGGAPCTSWYDIYGLAGDAAMDTEGLDSAAATIAGLLSAEAELVGWDNVGVMGFSQGGVVSYHTMLSGLVPKVAVVVALSAYLPRPVDAPGLPVLNAPGDDDPVPEDAALRSPIFHGHGTYDMVVGYEWGKKSVDALLAAGFDLEFHEYDGMGHSLCPQEFVDIKAFIRTHLMRSD